MKDKEFFERLESEANELDLSRDEDLSVGLMNLISLEEHLFFTHEKTGSDESLEILSEIRKIRTDAMKELVDNTEGEEWCISKHLLAASMRFRETGDKMLEKDREKAEEFYDKAFSLYSLFWTVNLGEKDREKIMEKEETEDTPEDKKDSGKASKKNSNKEESFLSDAKNLVRKAVDCCKEI